LMVKVRVDILAATGGEALSGGYTSASESLAGRSEQGFRGVGTRGARAYSIYTFMVAH
jgi:hypothetical protein